MTSNCSPIGISLPVKPDACTRDAGVWLCHLAERSRGFLFDPSFCDIEIDNGVALEVRYSLPAFQPSLFTILGVSKPEALAGAVPQRQGEFLAGRVMAQTASGLLGHEGVSIAIGKHRAPVWPRGLSGSISHAGDRCMCVVVADERAAVGIDIEKIVSGRSLEAILQQTLVPRERDMIGSRKAFDVNILASLVFSAKETLFKALYPVVGDYFGFDAAELIHIPEHNELCLKLTRDLHVMLPANSRFTVRFSIADDYVRTWLIHDPGFGMTCANEG